MIARAASSNRFAQAARAACSNRFTQAARPLAHGPLGRSAAQAAPAPAPLSRSLKFLLLTRSHLQIEILQYSQLKVKEILIILLRLAMHFVGMESKNLSLILGNESDVKKVKS